jgi:hypothetical protein
MSGWAHAGHAGHAVLHWPDGVALGGDTGGSAASRGRACGLVKREGGVCLEGLACQIGGVRCFHPREASVDSGYGITFLTWFLGRDVLTLWLR